MKCGTSTVCAYLEDHPDVFMLPNAEPNFFNDDANWGQGPAAYEALFDTDPDLPLRGVGSNDYANLARFPETVSRMADYRSDLRLLYMVRHPLTRLRSDWIQRRVDSGDQVGATLDEAVGRTPEIFLDQSFYWKQLSAYLAHFPKEQIFVGFLEDMQADRDAFFARVAGFLGVSPHSVARGHVNPSAGKKVPSPLYSRIRALPGFALAQKITPEGLRTALKTRVLSRPVQAVAPLSETTRRTLVDALRPDAAALLAWCGKPADFWDLDGWRG